MCSPRQLAPPPPVWSCFTVAAEYSEKMSAGEVGGGGELPPSILRFARNYIRPSSVLLEASLLTALLSRRVCRSGPGGTIP